MLSRIAMAFGSCWRDIQKPSRILVGHADEEPKFYKSCFLGRFGGEFRHCFIKCQQFLGRRFVNSIGGVEVDPLMIAAVFESSLSTSTLDQNSPHCFGGRAKEVTARIPVLLLIDVD